MEKQYRASSVSITALDTAEARVPAPLYLCATELFQTAFTRSPRTAEALSRPHIVFDAYGRILGVSPSVAEAFGYDERMLVGRRLIYRVLGPERSKLLQALLSLRRGNAFEPPPLRFHRRDGSSIEVRLEAVTNIEGPHGTRIVVCAPHFGSSVAAHAIA